jgi:hypothetical protein
MVRLYGKLSVDGPVAVNRYRQKHGVGVSMCEIIITSNPGRFSAPVVDNIMKLPSPKAIPVHKVIDERQEFRKLGKLVYTTKEGETFTAYHSVVFPKIVNESDKIVYPDKNSWYEAMRLAAPFRCD